MDLPFDKKQNFRPKLIIWDDPEPETDNDEVLSSSSKYNLIDLSKFEYFTFKIPEEFYQEFFEIKDLKNK